MKIGHGTATLTLHTDASNHGWGLLRAKEIQSAAGPLKNNLCKLMERDFGYLSWPLIIF